VVWIEEPVDGPEAWLELPAPGGVRVYRPRFPGGGRGFNQDHLPAMSQLIQELITNERLAGGIAWLYTPLALPLARMINPVLMVYDCMDELSLFQGAPPELLQMETALLEEADLVFTGGRSLYNAKKSRHPAVHCFPSSVDASHFRRATPNGTAGEIEAQAGIPNPRLGFFGVIDERLDIGLVDAIARAHPDWQIILVGPVVKIDPASLPRHPNIHYFGQQAYEDLPSFLAGWDVCLLPFALNAATRFISPTKTLEYMAAERPIVSTPITDVVEPYRGVVFIGGSAGEFIARIEQALSLKDEERSHLVERMRAVVRETSWERTAEQMNALVAARLAPAEPARSPVNSAVPVPDWRPSPVSADLKS
jgi:UDP-galactopyranose mutase